MERMEILYLSQKEVASFGIPMAEIVIAVEKRFIEMGNGRVEMPPKPGIHPGADENIYPRYAGLYPLTSLGRC